MTAVAEAFATAGETPWDSVMSLILMLLLLVIAIADGYCYCRLLLPEVTIDHAQ